MDRICILIKPEPFRYGAFALTKTGYTQIPSHSLVKIICSRTYSPTYNGPINLNCNYYVEYYDAFFNSKVYCVPEEFLERI